MATSTRLDIDKTLAKLTLGQKVKLLSGLVGVICPDGLRDMY